MPPCTTKRRTITNLKTKNNQNYQKIKLCGSLTIKELKETFIQTGRRGRDRQLGREDFPQGTAGGMGQARWWLRTGWSHIFMRINWEEQMGSRTDLVPARGNKAANLLLKTPVGVEVAGETPSLTGEFTGETHRVLECTQTHPPRNQHQKGPTCLWAMEELTKTQPRVKQAALFPLRPLPHIQCHNASGLPRPGEHLRLCPFK